MKTILMMIVLPYLSCTTTNQENQIKGDCILVEVTELGQLWHTVCVGWHEV
jgi:hypothetical protein